MEARGRTLGDAAATSATSTWRLGLLYTKMRSVFAPRLKESSCRATTSASVDLATRALKKAIPLIRPSPPVLIRISQDFWPNVLFSTGGPRDVLFCTSRLASVPNYREGEMEVVNDSRAGKKEVVNVFGACCALK